MVAPVHYGVSSGTEKTGDDEAWHVDRLVLSTCGKSSQRDEMSGATMAIVQESRHAEASSGTWALGESPEEVCTGMSSRTESNGTAATGGR